MSNKNFKTTLIPCGSTVLRSGPDNFLLEQGSHYFAEHTLTELHINKIRVHFTKIKDKFKSNRNEDVNIFFTKRARIVFQLTTTTLSLTVWHPSAVEEAKDILQTLLTIYEEEV